MSERKWSCGCYEHDGVVTPCKVDQKLNPTCFRLQEEDRAHGMVSPAGEGTCGPEPLVDGPEPDADETQS